MKKVLLIVLFVLLLSSVCYAENFELAGIVCNKFNISNDIPCEISEYDDYSSFSWDFKDYSVFADVYSNGNVIDYKKEKKVTDNASCLPVLSKEEAIGNSNAFINKIAPEIISQVNLTMASTVYSKNHYVIIYYRRINNIIYKGNYLEVYVDGETGEIIKYSNNFESENNFNIPSETINLEQAYGFFKENNMLRLEYKIKLVNNKSYSYLVYAPKPDVYIGAEGGKIITSKKVISSNGYFDVSEMFTKNNFDGGQSFNSEDSIIAQEKIKAIKELNITDDYYVSQGKYLSNKDDTNIIELTLYNNSSSITASYDVKNDILVEFNRDTFSSDSSALLSKDFALVAANNYVNKYMSKYKNDFGSPYVYSDDKAISVLYERKVNEIPFGGNGICISFDKFGNIINISCKWDNIDFEKPDNIIDINSAYDNIKLELSFCKTDESKLTAVYMIDSSITGVIDANNGNPLNYDGSILYPSEKLNYVDIEKHYSKDYALKLANCDFFVSRGNVYLDSPIRQRNYLLLISKLLPDIKPITETFGVVTDEQWEMLYNSFIMNKVIDKGEVNPNGYVTRLDAVKFLLRILKYKDVSELSDIYIVHFDDCDDILPIYRGYVELSRAMGIIHGSNGKFYPNENLKNGDALIMIYNYLNTVTEQRKQLNAN